MATWGKKARIIGVGAILAFGNTAIGQLSAVDLESLRQQGQAQGWTFNVGPTSATGHSMQELCGLVPPPNHPTEAAPPWVAGEQPVVGLPASFDWRTVTGCPPIRNQGGCGSCWAFATMGAVECAIKRIDRVSVDLSEQWLVSCNTYGYGCGGGWWSFDYFVNWPDTCGKIGAELEADFPYAAADVSCVCAPRTYRLTSWSEVDAHVSIPTPDVIKQAIMNYGPVAVGVRVDSAFNAYQNGVFNASASGSINHGVVLVGWDDTQGTGGVWFLRNSWGPGWGESGYMRIAYGCSSVGYGAAYVVYPGAGIVTSVDQASVPENGTTTFQVHLMAPPATDTTVSVSRVSGDSDVSVSSGASLTFTPSNWKTDQTVTLAAADDPDNLAGQATIRCSATGLQSHDVVATEVDDDPMVILTDVPAVTVSENGSANLRIKLSSVTAANVVVSCARISGDTDLSITAGATLTFTAANWNTYQTITFSAANDADVTNGSAIFRLSASGLPNLDVVVTESDDDIITILPDISTVNVPEDGTSTFRVRLSGAPGPSGLVVTVARISGDQDITVQSGSSLTFTSANWSIYQTVTLHADPDADAVNGQAVIRCSSPGSPNADVTATEQDDTAVELEVDRSTLTVPEGHSGSFGVRLGWQPASNVTVTVSAPQGDASLSISSATTLTFTPANWDQYQSVTVAAAQDDDAINGQAVVQCVCTGAPVLQVTVNTQDDDTLSIVTETSSLTVPEGTTGSLKVRLKAAPPSPLTVSTVRLSGNSNVNISAGSVLTFNASNWNTFQTVEVTVDADDDVVGSQAVFRCSAAGLPSVDATVNAPDPDVMAIEADRSQVTVPEGEAATFAARLTHRPADNVVVQVARVDGDSDITVASGGSLVFTPTNWDSYQQVTLSAADDPDLLDGQATIRCSASGLADLTVTAVEQDMEVSPYEPNVPVQTDTDTQTQPVAPQCGIGVSGAALACMALGLVSRRHGFRAPRRG